MNTIQKLLSCLLLGLLTFSYACSDNDDDPVGCNWTTEVQAESEALTAALNVWSANPTTENCLAYKDAAQDYHDALEDNKECATTAGNGAEIQAALDSIQASIDAIVC